MVFYKVSLSDRSLHLIVTSADPNLPILRRAGSVPGIGYVSSIAIQGTTLDYTYTFVNVKMNVGLSMTTGSSVL